VSEAIGGRGGKKVELSHLIHGLIHLLPSALWRGEEGIRRGKKTESDILSDPFQDRQAVGQDKKEANIRLL